MVRTTATTASGSGIVRTSRKEGRHYRESV